MSLSVITIKIAPTFQLGPVTLAWHGLTIAIGILIGGLLARHVARSWGLSDDPLYVFGVLVVLGGLIGGRLFYLIERDPVGLFQASKLFSGYGYTFDGGVILSAVLIAAYVWRQKLSLRYLDAAAVGLTLGVAIGRIGDVINGEHYGARSNFFLAVRNANPEAKTPNPHLAYQNGGLYEMLLAAGILAITWPLRNRLPRPTDAMWLVLGLFAVGRFLEFFLRSDSPQLALGLNNAQWTSLALLIVVVIGWALTRRRMLNSAADPEPGLQPSAQRRSGA